MLPVSAGFLAALASPHQVTVRADVSKGGVRLASSLPVLGGSITVDSSSITRRTLTLDLAPRLHGTVSTETNDADIFIDEWQDGFGETVTTTRGHYADFPTLPREPGDPLGHYGQEISVQWGLIYTGGAVEWLPLGVFRVESVRGSLLGDGAVTVTGVSREAFVEDARFTSPRTASSASAVSLIGTLIHEVLPGVEVISSASMDRRVPRTTWDEDRWDAISDLADSIAAVVYADPWGRFIIEDRPTLTTAPVWRVAAGPGGVLLSADASSSRAKVYNGVIVRGESPSSDAPPVQDAAYDLAPGSPTRWGDPHAGAFGMVPFFMSIPNVTKKSQCRTIALANLAKHTGAAASLDVTSVPNPAIEALDVVEVIPDAADPVGSVRRHIVDSFTIDLGAGGRFPMSTRDIGTVDDA